MPFEIEATSLAGRKPAYLSIADALGQAIDARQVAPGEALPTHRALAHRLGIAIATVSKAYAEAARRGLIEGYVGRGSFVAAQVDQSFTPRDGLADLSIHRAPPAEGDPHLAAAMARFADAASLGRLLDMQPNTGSDRHRESGAALVRRSGLPAGPQDIVVCNGGQHAMLAALASQAENPGVVLTEQLTDPSLKAVATLLGRRLFGVPIDDGGIQPDALADLCARHPVAMIIVTPNLHNPTNAVLSAARRKAVAGIARRHGALIFESDLYGVTMAAPPRPIASYAPERTLFVTSLGKLVGAGIKAGYIWAPGRIAEVAAGLRLSTWMASPFGLELAHRTLADPAGFDAMAARRRADAAERAGLAQRLLQPLRVQTHPDSWHAWLTLPEHWSAAAFVAALGRRGISLAPPSTFAVGREPGHAVRLCLGGLPVTELERVLQRVAAIARGPDASSIAFA